MGKSSGCLLPCYSRRQDKDHGPTTPAKPPVSCGTALQFGTVTLITFMSHGRSKNLLSTRSGSPPCPWGELRSQTKHHPIILSPSPRFTSFDRAWRSQRNLAHCPWCNSDRGMASGSRAQVSQLPCSSSVLEVLGPSVIIFKRRPPSRRELSLVTYITSRLTFCPPLTYEISGQGTSCNGDLLLARRNRCS